MTTTLLKNGYVITMDPARSIIDNGAILIEDQLIKAIGPTSKIVAKYKDIDNIVDLAHHAVMPGLINTHNHLFQILLKSMGDDLDLIDWIHACILPHLYKIGPKDLYYAAAAGSIELLKSGCTTNADMSYLVHAKLPNLHEEAAQASLDTGIRGYIVRTSENTDQFDLRQGAEREQWLQHVETLDQMIRNAHEYYKRWNGKGNGRIYAASGPNWPPGSDRECLQAYSELVKETGLKFQYHIAETKWEFDNFKQKYGMTPTEWTYKQCPEMGSVLWGVHCVWLTDHDIDIFAKTRTGVSHNTTSNFYLSSGVAPIPKLLAKGVPCGLGVDGAASNNTNNMWEMLKLTAFMHKVHNLKPTIITAEDVLEMATILGAETLGLQREIGSLEPGKKADIIGINLDSVSFTPMNRIVSQLVYCGSAWDVDMTMVNGEIVMDKRKILRVDEQKIREGAQKATNALVERAGTEAQRRRPWRSHRIAYTNS